MIWNIRKQKTTNQKNKKRIPKKYIKGQYKQPVEQLQVIHIHIIGVPEAEEKEQEIGNLFEKLMKENFLNLVKEIDMQVQEAQSPKQNGCKEAHSKTHHN